MYSEPTLEDILQELEELPKEEDSLGYAYGAKGEENAENN
jgi:hypothetical protein